MKRTRGFGIVSGFGLVLMTFLYISSTAAQSNKDSIESSPQVISASVQNECSSVLEISLSDEFIYIVAKGVNNFVETLNKVGAKGYRVQSITKAYNPDMSYTSMEVAAVLRMDKGNRYEYDWFEAFMPGEIVTRINYRSKNGFYLKDHIRFGDFCNQPTGSSSKSDAENTLDWLMGAMSTKMGHIFLLERRNGIANEIDYQVISGTLGWGKKPSQELQSQLTDKTALGLHPVLWIEGNHFPSILLEKNRQTESLNHQPREYKVIRVEMPGTFKKKINQLAKEGYELILYDNYNGVLGKTGGTSKSTVSYQFLDAMDKAFTIKLQGLASHNAMFQTTGYRPNSCDFNKANLVFAQGEGGVQRGNDYEVVKMPWIPSPDSSLSFNQSAKDADEAVKEFRRLTREGYRFRDLIFPLYSLFERPKSGH